jgi:hypothetical protein
MQEKRLAKGQWACLFEEFARTVLSTMGFLFELASIMQSPVRQTSAHAGNQANSKHEPATTRPDIHTST